MSTKNNPGPNSCYDRAALDEPIFTLLGRDPTAPFVVLFWCKMRAAMNASTLVQLVEAAEVSEAMRDWAMKLGKSEPLQAAFIAFKAACFEVARTEFEAAQHDNKEIGGI